MRLWPRRQDVDDALLEECTPAPPAEPKAERPKCERCGLELVDVTCFDDERREYICSGCGHHQQGDLVA